MDDRTFTSEVATRLACDERRATDVVFAVFHELRERLTPDEAHDVAAQLPTPLKRLWEAGDLPARTARRTHRSEFVADVRAQATFPDDPSTERAIRVVFGVLQELLGSRTGQEGEAGDVLNQLPADLKALWLAAARRA